jgi:predicted acyl esterase
MDAYYVVSRHSDPCITSFGHCRWPSAAQASMFSLEQRQITSKHAGAVAELSRTHEVVIDTMSEASVNTEDDEAPTRPVRFTSAGPNWVTNEDWTRQRDAITNLYFEQEKPLKEVKQIMESKHGFHTT